MIFPFCRELKREKDHIHQNIIAGFHEFMNPNLNLINCIETQKTGYLKSDEIAGFA